MTRLDIRRCAVMLALVATVACGGGDDDSDNPVGPGGGGPGGSGITNNTDDFQHSLTNLTDYSTNGGYTWRNTGTSARVTQSSNINAGSGTLIVRDAGGRIVYQRNLNDGGTVTTDTGPTGDWRIEVAPANVSGSLVFRVQKN